MNKIIGKEKKLWIGIALVNLAIVALLGFVLRSKIIFSIPFLDYKNTLHAHSHFAFGGWVTIALLALLTYEVLPASRNKRPVYKWLLGGILFNAVGMLISFPFQGYGFYPILFSTLFILVTYVYSYVFIKDILKTRNNKTIKLLSISALVYLVISSVGPFTLAYMLASKSGNVLLYKDAIYTYLHLQYNGFFTLAIIALLFNRIEYIMPKTAMPVTHKFAHILNFTVIPSLFLSFLWHYPNIWFRVLAITGSISLVVCIIYFFITAQALKSALKNNHRVVKIIGLMSMTAFFSKMLMQSLTIFPILGALVFANRPMIIGFLHLVLLGFVSLYLLAHFLHAGYLKTNRASKIAAYVFTSAVVINEALLLMQGFGVMFMTNSVIYAQLLWVTAAGLLAGAVLLVKSYYTSSLVTTEKGIRPITRIIESENKKS